MCEKDLEAEVDRVVEDAYSIIFEWCKKENYKDPIDMGKLAAVFYIEVLSGMSIEMTENKLDIFLENSMTTMHNAILEKHKAIKAIRQT